MNEQPWSFQPVIKDPELEEKLKHDGYLVFKQFLDEDAVNHLVKYNTENKQEQNHDGIFNSIWHSSDVKYKEETIKKIKEIYTPSCEKYFVDYKIFGGSFIIKPPHGKGESNPHIDFGIVNEDVHRSFSLWIPLVPMREENGALRVLKGSHRLKRTFRGPNIPDQTLDTRSWLWDNMDLLILEPGDAVLYDHRAIHGSKDNFSNVDRVAATAAVTNADADMVLYFWDESKQRVVAYETDPMYLLTNNHDQLPVDLKIMDEWDYDLCQLTLEDLGVKSIDKPEKNNLFKKFQKLLQLD